MSAIHSTGPEGLEIARKLAAKPQEHTLLRKAAISRLGRYGDRDDLQFLESLANLTPQMEQAVTPALKKIRHRLTHPDSTKTSRF